MNWSDCTALLQFVSLLRHENFANSAVTRLGEHGLPRSLRDAPDTIKLPSQAPTAAKFLESNLSAVLESTPARHWAAVLSAIPEARLPLSSLQIAHIRAFSERYEALMESGPDTRLESVEAAVRLLADALSWEYVKSIRFGNNVYHTVRPATSDAVIPEEMPVIITILSPQQDPTERYYETRQLLEHLSSDANLSTRAVINLVVASGELALRYAALSDIEDGIVLLTEGQLARILAAESYNRQITRVIRASLGVHSINPYKYTNPVHDPRMFYGRRSEIRRITTQGDGGVDYLVIGPRRIGKSSLCHQAMQEFGRADDVIPVYVDCATVKPPVSVGLVKRLTERINPRRADKMQWVRFEQMFMAARSVSRKKHVLFLDEVDPFLDACIASNDWQPVEVLRHLSSAGRIQVISTGYRTAYYASLMKDSPLFNFAQPMWLSTLSSGGARRLIEEPMGRIGITCERKVVNNILEQTGRQPSFVQFYCHELLEGLAASGLTRIKWGDVRVVEKSEAYRRFVLGVLYVPENFTPRTRLVLYVIANGNRDEFSVRDMLTLLDGEGIGMGCQDLLDVLMELELAGLLQSVAEEDLFAPRHEETAYEIQIPAFPRLLRKTLPLDREIDELGLQQTREEG